VGLVTVIPAKAGAHNTKRHTIGSTCFCMLNFSS
jgi:hypothetical protein